MAINGKTILGNTGATALVTYTDTELALTYYVVSNKSDKHATIHISAGTSSNPKVVAIIPLPPKKSYYSEAQFRLIIDSALPNFYVKNIETGDTAANNEIDVAASYFTK